MIEKLRHCFGVRPGGTQGQRFPRTRRVSQDYAESSLHCAPHLVLIQIHKVGLWSGVYQIHVLEP